VRANDISYSLSSRLKARDDQCPSLKIAGRKRKFSCTQPFILFQSSMNWLRCTHTKQGNPALLTHMLISPRNNSDMHPEIMSNQISGYSITKLTRPIKLAIKGRYCFCPFVEVRKYRYRMAGQLGQGHVPVMVEAENKPRQSSSPNPHSYLVQQITL
jgi:hypothetical protein